MSKKKRKTKKRRGPGTRTRRGGAGRAIARAKAAEVLIPSAPLLTMSMMVKDEEEFLEDALLSCKDWVDEMVVVDTGSTDRTVEIAQDLGAVVSYFPWCDDFAAARNETMRRASGQWIAILDADERFVGEDPAAVRQILKPGQRYPFECLMIEVRNVGLDGRGISAFQSIRFFANDPRVGYRGRVHNSPVSFDPKHRQLHATLYRGLELVHLGYDKTIYKARRKSERSLPLIEATVAESPDNILYRFYLGREYLTLGRVDEAVEALEGAVAAIARLGELRGVDVDAAMETYLSLLQAYRVAGKGVDELDEVAKAALAIHPKHPDFWWALGLSSLVRGDYEDAAEQLERTVEYLDAPMADRRGRSELDHQRWHIWEQLGHARFHLGRYAESYEAFRKALPDKPESATGWPEMLNCLVGLAIDLGDPEPVPDLLDRLLRREDTQLGMLFYEVQRRINVGERASAAQLLQEACDKCARVATDEEYAAVAGQLGLS